MSACIKEKQTTVSAVFYIIIIIKGFFCVFSGNEAKITRAKKWNHWFIDDNLKCDMDLVSRTVYS